MSISGLLISRPSLLKTLRSIMRDSTGRCVLFTRVWRNICFLFMVSRTIFALSIRSHSSHWVAFLGVSWRSKDCRFVHVYWLHTHPCKAFHKTQSIFLLETSGTHVPNILDILDAKEDNFLREHETKLITFWQIEIMVWWGKEQIGTLFTENPLWSMCILLALPSYSTLSNFPESGVADIHRMHIAWEYYGKGGFGHSQCLQESSCQEAIASRDEA